MKKATVAGGRIGAIACGVLRPALNSRRRNRRRRDVPSPHPWLRNGWKDREYAGGCEVSGEEPFQLSPCHCSSPEPPISRRGTPPVAVVVEELLASRDHS